MKKEIGMSSAKLAKLVYQLCEVFEKNTGYRGGHVHFMYEAKSDHLVLVCYGGKLEQIVAQNNSCKKDQSIHWHESEFGSFSPREAFLRFFDQVDKIIIDMSTFQRSWNSLSVFLEWINKTSKRR